MLPFMGHKESDMTEATAAAADSILKSRDITLPIKVRLARLWFFQWSCMDVRVGL